MYHGSKKRGYDLGGLSGGGGVDLDLIPLQNRMGV